MKRSAVFRGAARLSVAGAIFLAGCGGGGGAGNNNQGVAFRATGFVRGLESIQAGRISCTEPNAQSAVIDQAFTLSVGTVIDFPNRTDPFANPCGGYIGLQNNLAIQAMNVQEVSVRYEIPGAAIELPTHSISFGQTIPPGESDVETPSGLPNLIYAELVGQMVPRNIIVFLNQNVNLLPETPYLMNAFFVARGQSDNGDQFQSNEIGYQFTIIP